MEETYVHDLVQGGRQEGSTRIVSFVCGNRYRHNLDQPWPVEPAVKGVIP